MRSVSQEDARSQHASASRSVSRGATGTIPGARTNTSSRESSKESRERAKHQSQTQSQPGGGSVYNDSDFNVSKISIREEAPSERSKQSVIAVANLGFDERSRMLVDEGDERQRMLTNDTSMLLNLDGQSSNVHAQQAQQAQQSDGVRSHAAARSSSEQIKVSERGEVQVMNNSAIGLPYNEMNRYGQNLRPPRMFDQNGNPLRSSRASTQTSNKSMNNTSGVGYRDGGRSEVGSTRMPISNLSMGYSSAGNSIEVSQHRSVSRARASQPPAQQGHSQQVQAQGLGISN